MRTEQAPRSATTSVFLDACMAQPVDHIPIWIMRQAGRYLPEYQRLREKYSFLNLCRTPELAAEVTLQPIRRFGFDAAIIFSDILLPLEPMGIHVDFLDDVGPRLDPAVRSEREIEALGEGDVGSGLAFLEEAVRVARAALPSTTALIGFAGSPWTLACYVLEGGSSKSLTAAKSLLFSRPDLAHRLLEKLARAAAETLVLQLKAGVDAVQIFDSWAEALAPDDYAEFSLRYIERVLEQLAGYPNPKILFSRDAGAHFESNRRLPIDVLSCDWRVDLARARRASIVSGRAADTGHPLAYQGNLDPVALLGDPDEMLRRADAILADNAPRPGYIFSLGHGVLPSTPPENVARLVERVHGFPIDGRGRPGRRTQGGRS